MGSLCQSRINSFATAPPRIERKNKMEEQNNTDAGRLAQFIDRIERLEAEKKELSSDISEVYSEAKGSGFDVKVMRQIIALRKLNPEARAENEFLRQEYKKKLGIEE